MDYGDVVSDCDDCSLCYACVGGLEVPAGAATEELDGAHKRLNHEML